MRWIRWTVLASILAALAVAAMISCATPPAQDRASVMTDAQKLERGEYLTTIAGCNDCHTPGTFYGAPDFGRKLSGSELGWVGPWGTSYARNLTPDLETGIGKWSADDIVKTIRTGQRADGTEVLPPMPWPMYSNMPDEDAYPIAAYLKSLPAVSHKVPDKLPPGSKAVASDWVLPQPPAWDAPKTPPAGAPGDSAAAAH
ncbi:MAG: cytochrome c [Candidatus Eiseniibacteriota bacterium]